MALARLGATRINSYDDASDNKPEALYCRLFYEPTAKALMRSHWWRFAKHRVQLSQDTETPEFQWDYAYHLPNDFLRAICVYDGSDLPGGRTYDSYELEGARLLIDESEVYLKYIRWMEEVPTWDPLFVKVMVLQLALELATPLSQDLKLKQDVERDLYGARGRPGLMSKVRAMDRQEAEHIGRSELRTWQDARFSDYA